MGQNYVISLPPSLPPHPPFSPSLPPSLPPPSLTSPSPCRSVQPNSPFVSMLTQHLSRHPLQGFQDDPHHHLPVSCVLGLPLKDVGHHLCQEGLIVPTIQHTQVQQLRNIKKEVVVYDPPKRLRGKEVVLQKSMVPCNCPQTLHTGEGRGGYGM